MGEKVKYRDVPHIKKNKASYLERSPSAVALERIVALDTLAVVEARVGRALARTANTDTVQTPWVLLSTAE